MYAFILIIYTLYPILPKTFCLTCNTFFDNMGAFCALTLAELSFIIGNFCDRHGVWSRLSQERGT